LHPNQADRFIALDSPEAEQETVQGREVGSPMAGPADHQELLLQEDALGDDGTRAARTEHSGNRRQEVAKQDE
jgi:hypothetical protein